MPEKYLCVSTESQFQAAPWHLHCEVGEPVTSFYLGVEAAAVLLNNDEAVDEPIRVNESQQAAHGFGAKRIAGGEPGPGRDLSVQCQSGPGAGLLTRL